MIAADSQLLADMTTRILTARFPHPDTCPECAAQHATGDTFAPSHDGSRHCRSGSLASGGKRSHCSCDACF